ncbi:MAG: ABC transporter permease [Candidatus Brocadiae bacterium]|nr:ABC transporter permease [Candidatus Brocadiia bacterium]
MWQFFSGILKILVFPVTSFLEYLGTLAIMFGEACYYLPYALPFRKSSKWKYILGQIAKIGFESLPIVFLMAFLLGVILALQAAKQLERFGATIYVADLVAISLTREIGPILISIIIAGRTGSAIASEIGTMLVTEEITALRAMGIKPAKILVMPKTVALFFGLPGLVLLGDFIGIAAGFFIGCFMLDISFWDYYNQTIKILSMAHIWAGIKKCFVFAIVISMVGAYRGFSVTGGAEGVGKATTSAVVDSIILIIAINSLFTLISYYQ